MHRLRQEIFAIKRFNKLNTVQILSFKICGMVFVTLLFINITPAFCFSIYYTQQQKKVGKKNQAVKHIKAKYYKRRSNIMLHRRKDFLFI